MPDYHSACALFGRLLGFATRLRLKNTVRVLIKSKRQLEEKLKLLQEAQTPMEYGTEFTTQKSTDEEVIPTRETATG